MDGLMRASLLGVIEASIARLLRYVNTEVGGDVVGALRRVREASTGLGAEVMEAIVRNVEVGGREGRPVCQDTGLVMVWLAVGDEFPAPLTDTVNAVFRGVARATEEVPLRLNAIDPLTGEVMGGNIGRGSPQVFIRPARGRLLEVRVLVRGGGSEAPCIAKALAPSRGFKGVAELVVDAVANQGFNACPPLFIGVGVGGTLATAVELAYESLLRPVGARSSDPVLAGLEERLLNLVNKLEIGPGGMGGGPTAVDVRVEAGVHHPASMGVAVVTNCWALRRGMLRIYPGGNTYLFKYGVGGGEWVRW